MKKLLLSLGSVAAVFTPFATLVACGDHYLVKTFGHTYGREEATCFILLIKKQGNIVETGNYYLSAVEAKAEKILQVIKTKAAATKPAEYTTLTIKDDLTTALDGENFLYNAKGFATNTRLSKDTVSIINARATQFYVKVGDQTKKPLLSHKYVEYSIQGLLNANKEQAVKYEAEDKKTVPAQITKDTVSELLKGTDLEFKNITLDASGKYIKSITTQAAGTKKSANDTVNVVKKELEKMVLTYHNGKTIHTKTIENNVNITIKTDISTALTDESNNIVVSHFPQTLKDVSLKLVSFDLASKKVLFTITSTKDDTVKLNVSKIIKEAS